MKFMKLSYNDDPKVINYLVELPYNGNSAEKLSMSIQYTLKKEIRFWLENNLISDCEWNVDPFDGYSKFKLFFQDPSDAILFKLSWI
jgi:hypothetical protein